MARKICVVTGTRAEYGLLYWLMKELVASNDFVLQVIATGMHLSPEFGLTYRDIEKEGFKIDAKVEMLMSSDSAVGIAKSIGMGVIGFADALSNLKPDLLLLLGDRFEILAAAEAALVAKIPVAHIAGGDTTEGAYDEAIRHSITKMSHLHFVSNDLSLKRVHQLGENPAHIFNVGNLAIDNINRLKLLNRSKLGQQIGFDFKEKNLLVTFHPATLDLQSAEDQFGELLKALDIFNNVGIIFTKPNADGDGRVLIKMIDEYVASHDNAKVYTSLGQLLYLSAIQAVEAVVGNSSSGIFEVPSLKKPTVNIGDRQKGRLMASTIINCAPESDLIVAAIRAAFEKDCSSVINPYGDGGSAQKIVAILKKIDSPEKLIKKCFFEV